VVWIPAALERQLFAPQLLAIVYILYDIMYIALLVGIISLVQSTLSTKGIEAKKVTLRRLVDTVLLVFVEMWFALVWNLNRKFRAPQLLLLIALPLLYMYWGFDKSLPVSIVLAVALWAYLSLLVHNCIRLSFSVMSFYSGDFSVVGAAKQSWALTHGKFVETTSAIVISLGSAFVLFAITAIILGIIAHLILLLFFIQPVAYALAVRGATLFAFAPAILGYHHSFASIFAQLIKKNQSAGRIRGILAKKTLSKEVHHSQITPKRSFAKKKAKKAKKKKK